MTTRGRLKWLIYSILLSGVALGVFLLHGRCGGQHRGVDPLNDSRFLVDHCRVVTEKPFEEVAEAFEQQLGRFDPDLARSLVESGNAEEARTRLAAMAGPSGFVLFGTTDHGSLLRLAGQKRKATEYVVGNPLFALEMAQHDIRASLYAPLRVLLYEDDEGRTCLEYDRPSSLFGQFGDDQLTPTATQLDTRLEVLVAAAIAPWR
jgi:uncharacterized protein (DUF302 family)